MIYSSQCLWRVQNIQQNSFFNFAKRQIKQNDDTLFYNLQKIQALLIIIRQLFMRDISDQTYKEITKKYKYFQDQRSLNQKIITNKLANLLSERNFINIDRHIKKSHIASLNKSNNIPLNKESTNMHIKNKSINMHIKNKSTNIPLKKQQFLYVCLSGNTPFDNQFQNLNLPGQRIDFVLTCYTKGYTSQQIKTCGTQLQNQARLLHERIQSIKLKKPIILVYHSYGTFIMIAYLKLFATDGVIGMIDLAGMPIRFISGLKQSVIIYQKMTMKDIEDNIDQLYQNHMQRLKKLGLTNLYPSKYHLIAHLRTIKQGMGLTQIYQYARHFPKVLKCFIYGRKDYIFGDQNLNEKAMFYTYQNTLQQRYSNNCRKIYQKIFNQKIQNIQQKFIYIFEEGFHSLHVQKKLNQQIIQIINNYLVFLEELFVNQPQL